MKLLLLLVASFGIILADQSAALKELTDGNIQFTANVYNELRKKEQGNFLVCPLSVDVVLALTQFGAKGRTAEQLISALHLPNSNEKITEAFKAIAPKLNVNGKYVLNSANKIYIKQGHQISNQFKSVATDVFKSEVENINFENNVQSAETMNKWVESKTEQKIKGLLSKDDIDKDTRAVLINAIYFHGTWVNPFHERATSKKPFYVDAKNTATVDMMEQTKYYNYGEDQDLDAKFLELPYEGDEVSMVIVLPNKKDGLPALEANINKVLNIPKLLNEEVHVQLPKFKTETTIQFKPILQELGVKDIFEDYAQLTGILANGEPLKVSKVIQKAFIEVDEKGTEAAAATAVIGAVAVSLPFPVPPPPKEFNADHPFIYILKSTHGVLFVGRYVEG